jgi:hypothetical protein
VLDEQGLDDRAQVLLRTMPRTGRVQRVMVERDLPLRVRVRQLALEPRLLVLVHVVAVEGEEARITLPERVEALPVHVEGLVEPLVRVVVIPERGVELDAAIEDRLVGQLELPREVLGSLGAVDIVPQHQDELVGKHRVRLGQPRPHLALCLAACARVTEHGEADRILRDRGKGLVPRADDGGRSP